MELSELAAYAREKHDIQEQHKWADFPGFSVLAEPQTGKWAALCMRQWDSETGEELQRCDIKCGRQYLTQICVPWLTTPFRMKGQNWVGVIMDRRTRPEIVFRLFDRAIGMICQQRAYTVILEEMRGNTEGLYHDTALPPRKRRAFEEARGNRGSRYQDTALPSKKKRAFEEAHGNTESLYHDTALPPRDKGLNDGARSSTEGAEPDTVRPAKKEWGSDASRRNLLANPLAGNSLPEAGNAGNPVPDPAAWTESFYRETELRPTAGSGKYSAYGHSATALPEVPQKIREMMRLYEYEGESLEAKSRNFYRQGKFMEDYEDDAPWTGDYRRYFTTYHDLHLAQLRGYFTWRTAVRKGEYRPIAASLAYMYVYELLSGIGTVSAEDALQKMQDFEKHFIDEGMGDSFMKRNLHRWMLDYAVLHNVPMETAQLYTFSAIAQKDRQMAVLKTPEKHTDEEIFSALCTFGGNKVLQSPVVKKDRDRGTRLFAALWRHLTAFYPADRKDRTGGAAVSGISASPDAPAASSLLDSPDASAASSLLARSDASGASAGLRPHGRSGGAAASGRTDNPSAPASDSGIFKACFGSRKIQPWHPLDNAVHWEEPRPQEAVYVMSECRTYRCRRGEWQEERYENPYFARERLEGLLHAADRGFRKYLKTGHYLRAKSQEAWAEPYIEAVIAADREAEEAAALKAQKEAAMARITIDLSGLEKIRQDAMITRDSLLTGEELEENTADAGFPAPERGLPATGETMLPLPEAETGVFSPGPEPGIEDRNQEPPTPVLLPLTGLSREENTRASGQRNVPPDTGKHREAASDQEGQSDNHGSAIEGLDALHTQILYTLLRGGSVEGLIRDNHLMPSLVADTINEALFDEVGDNVLECEDDTLEIIEDYRDDLVQITGVSG